MTGTRKRWLHALWGVGLTLALIAACTSGPGPTTDARAGDRAAALYADTIPPLEAVSLAPGEKLRVVATTTILADVVAQVGGDQIQLTGLLPPETDPHSYQPTPQDLRALAQAQVIFINGLGLEDFLAETLANAGSQAPIVPVSTGVAVIELDQPQESEEASHERGRVDPHVWFSVPNVVSWTQNIQAALSQLDPERASAYAASGQAYRTRLQDLDAWIREQVATVPPERRKLVTDHLAFGYFAREYGFQQIGALVPSFSTSARPSAQQLAKLQEQIRQEGVQAIFVGMSVNPELAEQVAQDLGIQVVRLYIGALSGPDGPAPTYEDFMRYDVNAIVAALR